MKKSYRDNPLFSDTKVVISVYDDEFKEEMPADIGKKVKYDGITKQDLAYYKKTNYVNLIKAAVEYSDGVIIGSPKINEELRSFAGKIRKTRPGIPGRRALRGRILGFL